MDRKKKFISILAAILAGILLLTTLMGILASVVHAAPASSDTILGQIDDLKAEQNKNNALLKELEEALQKTNNEIEGLMDRKDGIDQQIGLLFDQIVVVTQQISAYNLLIADKQRELQKAEENLEALNKKYKERIRAMEEQGALSYLAVIMGASDFVDLLDRMNMMVEIANADQKRLEALKEASKEVAAAREKLAAEKESVELVKLALEDAEAVMKQKRAEADALLRELIAKGDAYQEKIEISELLQDQLMQEIAGKKDEYDKAKYEEWLATSVPPTTTHPAGDNGNKVDGKVWYVPTKNFTITSKFGPRTHPITGEKDKMHNGIDMAANTGTPIYATRSGVVTVASYQEGGAGYYVSINHNDGYKSIYMHMTHYIVKKGDYVTAGQIIGYVGSTGGSTGPHLHFGISKDGRYVDPLKYIKV